VQDIMKEEEVALATCSPLYVSIYP